MGDRPSEKQHCGTRSSWGNDAAEHPGFSVVGFGASAGGLEAVSQLLRHVPGDLGMAFVVVQHLDPVHHSSLAELLSRVCPMPVREAADRLSVEPDHVYVIPPNACMVLQDGALHLTPRVETRELWRPIDLFLRSLAEERRGRAIGVVLSGTGSDGTSGLEAIRAEGGITFAQDATAAYGGMPTSATRGRRGGVLTLANRLTILRILMTPAITILLLYKYMMAAAIALFVLAAITDGLYGFVARRQGQRTALGMVLDPLADKLLLMSAVVVLTILRELPRWFTIIIVSRDLMLIAGSLILYMFVGKMSMPPSWLGKFTTGFQIATVLLAMLDNFAAVLRSAVMPVAFLTTALKIGSGLDYVFRGTR